LQIIILFRSVACIISVYVLSGILHTVNDTYTCTVNLFRLIKTIQYKSLKPGNLHVDILINILIRTCCCVMQHGNVAESSYTHYLQYCRLRKQPSAKEQIIGCTFFIYLTVHVTVEVKTDACWNRRLCCDVNVTKRR